MQINIINPSSKMQEKVKKGLFVSISIIIDGVVLLLLTSLALKIRVDIMPAIINGLPVFTHPLKRYLWLIPLHLGVLAYEGAYTKRATFWDEVRMLWKSTILTTVITLFILFATKQSEVYSRLVILTWSFLCIILLPLLRPGFKRLLYRMNLGKARLLIVGAGENGRRMLKALRKEGNLGYEVAGFVDNSAGSDEIDGVKVYRFIDSVERYIDNSNIKAIAITACDKSWKEIAGLINRVSHRLETVFYVPELKEIPVMGSEIRHFLKEDIFALELKNNLEKPLNYLLKRTTDYIISILLLPFIIPLIVIFSILIRLTSKGPAIFTQERIGKNGRTFRCYKFRTMYVDAEERLKALLESNEKLREEWARNWKLRNDPRVTGIGRFLRKTSLDELPQIFNVLKGDMSLVGPRPVVKDELERYYRESSAIYCLVPPGITGLWQVSGRSNTTYEGRVALDCWYVRNWSLWLDIVILLKTAKAVLKKEGAY